MKGRIIKIWADVALTEENGRFVLWASDGKDYGKRLRDFETEAKARNYAVMRDRLKLAKRQEP